MTPSPLCRFRHSLLHSISYWETHEWKPQPLLPSQTKRLKLETLWALFLQRWKINQRDFSFSLCLNLAAWKRMSIDVKSEPLRGLRRKKWPRKLSFAVFEMFDVLYRFQLLWSWVWNRKKKEGATYRSFAICGGIKLRGQLRTTWGEYFRVA